MQVLLQITAGPALGRRFRLRQGQVARVGRTEWSDFSVPDDGQMADVHFEIQCDAYVCRVRQLNAADSLLRNGEPIDQSRIRSGDTITAGSTTFAVALEGVSGPDPADPDSEALDAESEDDDQPAAADACVGVSLSEKAQQRMNDDMKAGPFFESLLQDDLLEDAARFLAAWLPRTQSVAWGCACFDQVAGERLTASQRGGVDAAGAWAADPTEEHRRAAQRAAEALGGKSPAGWLALAAFWGAGSIGPPEAAEIPAAVGISARAVGTAVVTIAAQAAGKQSSSSVLRGFVEEGRKRLEEQHAAGKRE